MSNFVQLTQYDLAFVVSRIPADVRAVLMKYDRIFIGGGFIRSTISGEKVSDIDVFGNLTLTLDSAANELCAERRGRKHETKNAITILTPPRSPVQFIKRWLHETPDQVVESFDFTVCQVAVWYDVSDKKWKSAASELFYPDLAAKRLTYTCPQRNEDAGGSILRVRKFLSRGYNIQAQSLARVIARLMKGVNDLNRAANDEGWLGTVLTSLLREVDPLTVVDGVEIVDEHQIAETVEAVK